MTFMMFLTQSLIKTSERTKGKTQLDELWSTGHSGDEEYTRLFSTILRSQLFVSFHSGSNLLTDGEYVNIHMLSWGTNYMVQSWEESVFFRWIIFDVYNVNSVKLCHGLLASENVRRHFRVVGCIFPGGPLLIPSFLNLIWDQIGSSQGKHVRY